jgi:hypothetical protein
MSDPSMMGGAVKQNMSVFNPADMAMKASSGDIGANMTVGEFLQKNFGVTMDTPMAEFAQKLAAQAKTGTMQGKLGAMGGGGMPSPQGGQPEGSPPISGMGDLTARLQSKGM